LATLRKAELGFLGVVVYTRVQTPRLCGLFCKAGLLLFTTKLVRGFLSNWLIVGITHSQYTFFINSFSQFVLKNCI